MERIVLPSLVGFETKRFWTNQEANQKILGILRWCFQGCFLQDPLNSSKRTPAFSLPAMKFAKRSLMYLDSPVRLGLHDRLWWSHTLLYGFIGGISRVMFCNHMQKMVLLSTMTFNYSLWWVHCHEQTQQPLKPDNALPAPGLHRNNLRAWRSHWHTFGHVCSVPRTHALSGYVSNYVYSDSLGKCDFPTLGDTHTQKKSRRPSKNQLLNQ